MTHPCGIYDGLMPSWMGTADPALRRLQLWSAVLLVAVCAVIAFITFWPGPPDPDGQRALREFLRQAHQRGLPLWITFGKIEFGSNMLMFVPIGLFGALALPRARWLILPAAVGLSALIEIVQALSLPERDGSLRDVVSNGLGAVIGYLLARVVIWTARRRTPTTLATGPARAAS